jgi:glucose/arabinose dehydrogenase
VFRLTRTGEIPADNPYARAPASVFCTRPGAPRFGVGPCQETYASGLRNPYRFAYRAAADTFYLNDVGQGRREEIDVLKPGADYGRSCFEGSQRNIRAPEDCPQTMGTTYTRPLYDYGHDTGCSAATAAAFVPESGWPWPGQYLFGDYVCGTIFRIEPQPGGSVRAVPFVTGLGHNGVVDFAFGPGRPRLRRSTTRRCAAAGSYGGSRTTAAPTDSPPRRSAPLRWLANLRSWWRSTRPAAANRTATS